MYIFFNSVLCNATDLSGSAEAITLLTNNGRRNNDTCLWLFLCIPWLSNCPHSCASVQKWIITKSSIKSTSTALQISSTYLFQNIGWVELYVVNALCFASSTPELAIVTELDRGTSLLLPECTELHNSSKWYLFPY